MTARQLARLLILYAEVVEKVDVPKQSVIDEWLEGAGYIQAARPELDVALPPRIKREGVAFVEALLTVLCRSERAGYRIGDE